MNAIKDAPDGETVTVLGFVFWCCSDIVRSVVEVALVEAALVEPATALVEPKVVEAAEALFPLDLPVVPLIVVVPLITVVPLAIVSLASVICLSFFTG